LYGEPTNFEQKDGKKRSAKNADLKRIFKKPENGQQRGKKKGQKEQKEGDSETHLKGGAQAWKKKDPRNAALKRRA